MNIILVGKRHGKSRALPINAPIAIGVSLFFIALLATAVWSGYSMAVSDVKEQSPSEAELVSQWQSKLDSQKAELEQVRQNVRQQVDALTLRLGEMQSRLLRLDALGQRFVETGVVASDEFDFSQPAAVGGPEDGISGESFTAPQLTDMIDSLALRIEDREHQLRMLDIVSSQKKLEDELYVEGRPITWGWLSSKYGYRSDPFTGKRTWHDGVDLAGREGSDIISVAAGVVTFAGERYGYGNLVEVDHGDGLLTRYAHAKSIDVNVGDVIQKGQVVAAMGSTGRSTGPHVHFEVLENGKSKNPETYIRRASR
ncbi:M23 family metallopeptidase [Marinobacter sp. CHS3-4]|uniref:peptidoglycan DD-metalloendopeptidase family protein n=1 Tax=Marinobacter sp. CHS3-4 TaxID=3045174 RepID=UPI0024B59775|nr:M23 family metallopeptidase [Marinobacter sp. CHS3-4]MDI9246255.1 M23 family metallopeptidase [Marinobacter sp. CHS3-4]